MKVTFTVKGKTAYFWEGFSSLSEVDKFVLLLKLNNDNIPGQHKTGIKIGNGSVSDSADYNTAKGKQYKFLGAVPRRGFVLVSFDVKLS